MKQINEILKKYKLKPNRYVKNGKATIVDTEIGRFVIKKNNYNKKIFNYLKSRNFNYYPKIINDLDEEYEISEYIEEIDYPNEQKMLDLINLISLLHSKTTHFKEIDYEDYKQIYEDIKNNIEYLEDYYNEMITIIESHVYMSPSEYLLARNISRIFISLNFCKNEIENWYNLIKDKTKQRVVVLHNNLDLSHFIKNDNSYLISWDKSKIGIPIFDLYILYKRHALDYDFSEILKNYEKNYPLKKEERILLFILIALPIKLEFNKSTYELTKEISNQMDIMYKTEKLISPYYMEQNI
ncbi:MAG TPA: hypothetical protein IAC20_03810 [Candidatus Faecisoma merdavium]|nr:hypothetical protein [Candidatus Faecisoma merdavium]